MDVLKPIRYLILVLLALSAYADFWHIETVDEPNDVGQYSSIAIDDLNNPRISYRDNTGQDLKYAEWTGSTWNKEAVDTEGNVGNFSAIALDDNGYAHISYYDKVDISTGHLKYAKWTGSSWSIGTVDNTGMVGLHTSIALDSLGYPRISYNKSLVNPDLKYAYWNGSMWTKSTVDATTNCGTYTSIEIDNSNYSHISYYSNTGNNLKYAKWNGSSWDKATIDSVGNVGQFTSLELDTNYYPHISYYDITNGHLKYAQWTGSDWNIETVDNGDSVGLWTSLALDHNGNPHISYYDKMNGDLKYTKKTGPDWTIWTVENTGNVGEHTSIALDSLDIPNISYYDNSNGNLKYAKLVLLGDAGTISVDMPSLVPEDTSFNPEATVRNFDIATAHTFDVTCTINPGAYTSTAQVNDLSPNTSIQIAFPDPFVFDNGSYTVTVYTQLAGDGNADNDTLAKVVQTYIPGIADGNIVAPEAFTLSSPTISRERSQINFTIPEETEVRILVYDGLGRCSKSVISDIFTAGYHSIPVILDLPSGVYFYCLMTSSGKKIVSKFLLIE